MMQTMTIETRKTVLFLIALALAAIVVFWVFGIIPLR
jgi:hypothetical protein